ncbi:hypothetical protein Acidovoranil_00140 [Acidovorax sp. FG27]
MVIEFIVVEGKICFPATAVPAELHARYLSQHALGYRSHAHAIDGTGLRVLLVMAGQNAEVSACMAANRATWPTQRYRPVLCHHGVNVPWGTGLACQKRFTPSYGSTGDWNDVQACPFQR